MKKLLLVFLIVFVITGIFGACTSDDLPKTQPQKNVQVSSSAEKEQKEPNTFGNVEIIEKDDGTKIARSETGLEVEYSNESLMELYDEYESQKGKDSGKEAELLAKIQMILEAQLSPTPLE